MGDSTNTYEITWVSIKYFLGVLIGMISMLYSILVVNFYGFFASWIWLFMVGYWRDHVPDEEV